MLRSNRYCAVAWCFLFLAAGCPPAPAPPEKGPALVRASQNGGKLYFAGKQQYGLVRAQDLQGPQLAKAMDVVMGCLDGAVTNDPQCPLFLSKRGEMFLELGPDSYDRATGDLNRAIKLNEDWTPAWIAMAELETRKGQPDRAGEYLKGAEKTLAGLQAKEKKKPAPAFKLLGLGVTSDEPKDPRDPSLEEDERRQLLLNWLQESEQWTIDSPSLLTPGMGGQGLTVNRNNLIRRFRARIEFQWIMLRIFRGEKPEQVLPLFDHVFEWDPDLFSARIQKAVLLRQAGQYRDAERLLRPYIESRDPKIGNNARLLYEMASIYTDWYTHEPNDTDALALAKLADQAFTRLHAVNQNHAEGWLMRAHLYAAAGVRAKKLQTLKDARQWVDNAREVLGKDTPEIKAARAEIDQAEKTITGKGPPK